MIKEVVPVFTFWNVLCFLSGTYRKKDKSIATTVITFRLDEINSFWLLQRSGTPDPVMRCYFSRSMYDIRTVRSSET